MSAQLKTVVQGSPADRAGLKSGDIVSLIDGLPPRDILDVMWTLQDGFAELEIIRGEQTFAVDLILQEGKDAGLVFEEDLFDGLKRCPNNCIFCFVHQQAKGLRKPLYVKDEDYRASFLYGNYVTLSNLEDEDLERIVEMQLSPLYVSVHTTNDSLRAKLLGRRETEPLLPLLDELGSAGIRFYTQIVLLPSWNDGAELEKTLEDLVDRYPSILATAVVPVGLTKHRQSLPRLLPVDRSSALESLDIIDKARERALKEHGRGLVYGADEFFLVAQRDIPASDYYENYPLLENGVGMLRHLLNDVESRVKERSKLKALASKDTPATSPVAIVTGKSCENFFKKRILPLLSSLSPPPIKVIAVENQLLGPNVTVSGLLSGRDVIEACKVLDEETRILICDYAISQVEQEQAIEQEQTVEQEQAIEQEQTVEQEQAIDQEQFLDGVTKAQIEESLQSSVIFVSDTAEDLIRAIFDER